MANYYSILGVSWSADIEAIKSAYQRLEKRYNSAANEAAELSSPRYARVRTAYEVLSDPIARQAYDSSLWRQRKVDRSRLARSFSIGVVGAVAVSAVLVGYLANDAGPQTLKSAMAAQSERDEIAAGPNKRAAKPGFKAETLGPSAVPMNADDKRSRTGGSLREVLTDERLAAEHDRLATRYASRMIGPGDFNSATRVATLPGPLAAAPTGNGATWHVELGKAAPPPRNPQRVAPAAPKASPVAPAAAEPPVSEAVAKPADKQVEPPKQAVGKTNPSAGAAAARRPEAERMVSAVAPEPTGLDDGKTIPGGSREPIQVSPPRAFPKAWSRQRYAGVGLSLLLPDKLFKPRMIADDGQDVVFATSDGRALLRVYARSGRGKIKPEALRNRLAKHRYGGAELSQNKILDDGFLLAGRIGGERFYERVYVRCDGRRLHAWMMVYPVSQHIFFDKIVAKLDESYKPVPARSGRCSG